MAENPRIAFFYTEKEWDVIESRIKTMGKRDLNCFVRGGIHKIGSLVNECPDCVRDELAPRKKKTCTLPQELYEVVAKAAYAVKSDAGLLLSRILIDPILFGE